MIEKLHKKCSSLQKYVFTKSFEKLCIFYKPNFVYFTHTNLVF